MSSNLSFTIAVTAYYGYLQLILHLLGDYLIQSDNMANKKTNSWLWAFIHSLTYSISFFLIGSPLAVLFIFLTHLMIDRFRLVRFILKLKEWRFNEYWGYITQGPDAKQPFMWIWLMIIADNSLHIIINYFSILIFGVNKTMFQYFLRLLDFQA